MIQTLIVVFLIFFIFLISKLFNEGFVRGEVFDATKLKVKPGSKSGMFLNELNDGINYINSHNMTWLYITSFDGLKLAARFFNNADPKKLVILFMAIVLLLKMILQLNLKCIMNLAIISYL